MASGGPKGPEGRRTRCGDVSAMRALVTGAAGRTCLNGGPTPAGWEHAGISHSSGRGGSPHRSPDPFNDRPAGGEDVRWESGGPGSRVAGSVLTSSRRHPVRQRGGQAPGGSGGCSALPLARGGPPPMGGEGPGPSPGPEPRGSQGNGSPRSAPQCGQWVGIPRISPTTSVPQLRQGMGAKASGEGPLVPGTAWTGAAAAVPDPGRGSPPFQ